MIIVLVSNYLIVGSGLSAFICFLKKTKSKVITNNFYTQKIKIEKSYQFYECNNLGGNTNIWGGYIDIEKLKKLKKKNKNFSLFIDKNFFFKINTIFSDSKYKKIGLISEKKKNKIFRKKKNFFANQIKKFNVEKIIIKKNYLVLKNNKNQLFAKKINLCVGNLGLLKILYNSKIIRDNDILTFRDGNIKYGLNFNLDKKNYNVPMSLMKILKTLIFGKTINYNKNEILNNLIVQTYLNNSRIYKYKVSDIINNKRASHLRFYISNHLTNLKINKVPIDSFIKKKTKKIIVNCSGKMKKYVVGPISQDIIYNSFLSY